MELDEDLRNLATHYRPSAKLIGEIKKAPLLLLAGITGAGKDTILERLIEAYPDTYDFIISYITRKPRPYEIDGMHYHFISFSKAKQLLSDGGYVETDVVHGEDIYGTTVNEVKRIHKSDKIGLTDVTIKGCDAYLDLGLNAKVVFLLPPSYSVWKERFGRRNDAIGKPELRRRLKSAIKEINHALQAPNYYIVINDDLHNTADLVNRIALGEKVEPHYRKAVDIAEEILGGIKAELSTLDA